jgi:acyl-CoA thioesterase I
MVFNMRNFLFYSFFVVLFACQKTEIGSTNAAKTPQTKHFRYLALGDSYTIGESVGAAGRFPTQLRDSLVKRGFVCDNDTVIARTGWTTRNLLSAISIAKPPANYDLVTLLIGVNNQFQRRSLSEYETEFQACLDEAVRLAKGDKRHVLVVAIPDYGYTPYGSSQQAQISAALLPFNAACKRITQQNAIQYADITPISQNNDAVLVAPDGLHPSKEQYRRWVVAFLAQAVGVLR